MIVAVGIGDRFQRAPAAHDSGREAMPQLREEARQTGERVSDEAERLDEDARRGGARERSTTGARIAPEPQR